MLLCWLLERVDALVTAADASSVISPAATRVTIDAHTMDESFHFFLAFRLCTRHTILMPKGPQGANSHPADELAGLRSFLARLESGSMKLSEYGKDLTQKEIGILKLEIKHLEDVLARLRKGGTHA
jgi:hypothetical protein